MLKEGDTAPDFAANDQDGSKVTLSRFRGKNVVLYFYPKDNTPGCTTEACDFRDNHDDIGALNAVVLGVSKDSEKSHIKFREKFSLPFILLADIDLAIHQKYGTWVEKKMYGKTYMGTQRATFIVGADGLIKKVYPKVSVKGHVDEIKADLAELK